MAPLFVLTVALMSSLSSVEPATDAEKSAELARLKAESGKIREKISRECTDPLGILGKRQAIDDLDLQIALEKNNLAYVTQLYEQCRPTTQKPSTTTPAPRDFPCTEKFGSSCYLYDNSVSMTWPEAEQFCQRNGGYLAEIDTEAEQKFIEGLLKRTGSSSDKYIWLGARRIGRDRVWTHSGKTVLDGYTNWSQGQPSYADYLVMTGPYYPSKSYQWAYCRSYCSASRDYPLCERDA
ncbi:secretory phospholipase A2 receptor [Lingula anatina]|uniref:Secretory phospholipase A2 receptor n=1 Tax=Lingula anatina TaxID=7574 RepID=A0A1S3JF02_LINAN|nr:secretory phospholipase A2 receptor [Lingula anatina]|eukprot:XP_013408726.1 secretory phospholipase A2 receptor [Lingula anatina]